MLFDTINVSYEKTGLDHPQPSQTSQLLSLYPLHVELQVAVPPM
jgi:hypothetical protein